MCRSVFRFADLSVVVKTCKWELSLKLGNKEEEKCALCLFRLVGG